MATLYPNALDSNITLPNVSDVAVPTKLSAPLNVTDSTISVQSTAGYTPLNGFIIIDSEQITYGSTTNTQFLNCTRGFNGSSVIAHNVSSSVLSYVTAQLYTNLRDSVLQIESLLGMNGQNVAIVQKTNSFQGSQTLSNGIILNTQANTGLDQWAISPTNDGVNAILNIIYQGNASKNFINLPSFSPTAHQIAYINNVTSSPNLTIDFTTSPNQVILLTGDVSSSTMTNAVAGQTFLIQITQDSVGGHLFVFPANFKQAPQLDKTPNTTIVLMYWFDGNYAWPVNQGSPL